ncbi:MAG: M1 family metallopeptidase [Caldilineaceae bacterium]|nr:M1 family metallopeptidase [Caldilineaceae bacterium]
MLYITKRPLLVHMGRMVGLPLLLLFLLLTLLTACGGSRVDPMARYLPAMRPPFQGELARLQTLPRYAINVEFFPTENRLLGKMRVDLVNTSPDPWPYAIFRLYPELADYKGNMAIKSTAVNGAIVPFSYQAHDTALLVQFPEFLQPDEAVTIDMSWSLDIPVFPDHSSVYVLFGQSQQMYTLPLFYPSLAVYQPAKGVSGEWWLTEGTIRGDSAFNVASLFVVTATMPADQVPVTSGTLITSTFIEGARARHVWVTGPSREFLLHTSTQFRSAHTEAYGTRVTSYWLPGQEAMGRAALNYGVAALRIYADNFGAYPYRDMRIAPAPLNFRGMEYPQVSLLGVEVYDQYRSDLELLLAHEVAHQWWYQLVHNDPVSEPWLDEALAEYSMKLYLEELRGERSAGNLLRSRWSLPVQGMQTKGDAALVNQAVSDFATASLYETVIYAKGALFYDAVRQSLGDRRFNNFLRDYLADHRYGIVTTRDWLQAIHALNTPEIEVLYEEWVHHPPARPALTPTPLIDTSSAQR